MKKLFALLLVAVMCFSLAACGGDKSNEQDYSFLYGTWESQNTYIVNGKEEPKYAIKFEEDGGVKYSDNEAMEGKGSTGYDVEDNTITFGGMEFVIDTSADPITITQIGDEEIIFTKTE